MPGRLIGARHARGGVPRDVALVLGLFALGGLGGGLLWRWLWTPFRGTAFQGVWYPQVNSSPFAGTGTYVLVGLGIGVLLGALSAIVADRRELLTLALVLAGSGLAAWIMLGVGKLGMPADPSVVARHVADRTMLPATLTVHGWSPLGALPAGAMIGVFVVFVGITRKPVDQPISADTAG